jgi:hypothetical protein
MTITRRAALKGTAFAGEPPLDATIARTTEG